MPTRLDDYARKFADRIIEALKQGTAPWQKPWKPGELSTPSNVTTGRRYRGNNAVMLMITGAIRGYGDTRWAGFGQIRRAGGMVRRGEKGTPILVWRERRGSDATGITGTVRPGRVQASPEHEEEQPRFFAAVYNVFNVEQADGLELGAPKAPEGPAIEPNAAVQQIAADAHVRIVHVPGDRACYSPSTDIVTMPERRQFLEAGSYEHTLLHELSHATSHPSRLDRPEHGTALRGSTEYALEELRAEISAMMLGEELHVGHQPRHGHSYVASWIQALDDDPHAVRKASADAQRIADWLTRNLKPAAEAAETTEEAAAA